MSVSHTSRAGDPAPSRTVESRYLYQIINTVSSSLDLDRVLRAIVDLVSEAIDCHACWIYFVDPDDGSLLLRAVSDPYGALVGKLRFESGDRHVTNGALVFDRSLRFRMIDRFPPHARLPVWIARRIRHDARAPRKPDGYVLPGRCA